MRGKSFTAVLILLAVSFGFMIEAEAADEEILIIVNEETSIKNLSLNMLVDIYTNNKTKWDGGEKIYVTMLKTGPVHEAFSNQVIGIAPKKLISIWKKVIFTGLGTPPKVVSTGDEMIQYVASTKGAVGYISASAQPENVTVFKLK